MPSLMWNVDERLPFVNVEVRSFLTLAHRNPSGRSVLDPLRPGTAHQDHQGNSRRVSKYLRLEDDVQLRRIPENRPLPLELLEACERPCCCGTFRLRSTWTGCLMLRLLMRGTMRLSP